MPCCYENGKSWCAEMPVYVYGGKLYCIFHLPMESPRKDSDVFFQQLDIYLGSPLGNSLVYRLNGTIFPVTSRIDSRMKELGEKQLYLEGASFYGNEQFFDVRFSDNFSFVGCSFFGEVVFAGGWMEGSFIAFGASFHKYVGFRGVNFGHGWIDFHESKFGGNCSFDGCSFCSRPDFNNVEFENVRFSGVDFKQGGSFEGITVHKHFSMNDCWLDGVSFRNSHFMKTASFDVNDVDIELHGVIADSGIKLAAASYSGVGLIGAPVENIRFVGGQWPVRGGRKTIREFTDEAVPSGVTLDEVEQTLRRLKQAARQGGDEMSASDFHYNEKEALRLRLAGNAGVEWKVKPRYYFLRAVLGAYKIISGYGEEPARALVLLGLLVVLPFVVVWSFSGDLLFDEVLTRGAWYLPLSGVDLGGGVKVSGWQTVGRVLVSVLVSAQAALFGFALRNKLRR